MSAGPTSRSGPRPRGSPRAVPRATASVAQATASSYRPTRDRRRAARSHASLRRRSGGSPGVRARGGAGWSSALCGTSWTEYNPQLAEADPRTPGRVALVELEECGVKMQAGVDQGSPSIQGRTGRLEVDVCQVRAASAGARPGSLAIGEGPPPGAGAAPRTPRGDPPRSAAARQASRARSSSAPSQWWASAAVVLVSEAPSCRSHASPHARCSRVRCRGSSKSRASLSAEEGVPEPVAAAPVGPGEPLGARPR